MLTTVTNVNLFTLACPAVDYASMCNVPLPEGTDSLRERIGYDYGPEGPEAPPYWDNYGDPISRGVPIFTDEDYNNPQPPFRAPVLRPDGNQPQPLDPYASRFMNPRIHFTSSR